MINWVAVQALFSPSMAALLVSVLSASLLGSLHCAGMCGPFVTVYAAGASGVGDSSRASLWTLHGAYQAGRAVTYTAVGALGGFLGSFVDWAGEAAGLARLAAWGSSLLLIVWGLSVLFPRLRMKTPWDGVLNRRLIQLRKKPPLLRASLLGTLTPLLPCGWFYAFAVTAAGTGSAVNGAVVLFVFWLGTVPALIGVGVLMGSWGGVLRKRVPVLTGALLIAIGIFGVVTRMRHPLDLGPTSQSATESNGTGPLGVGARVKCH